MRRRQLRLVALAALAALVVVRVWSGSEPAPPAPLPTAVRASRTAEPAAEPARPGSGSRVRVRRPRGSPSAPLPTTLPDTPEIAAWLHEQGTPDVREMHQYLLGLNAHVETCMGGAVQDGEIRFWVHWVVGENHTGQGSYEPDPVGGSTGFDEADRERFERCVAGYLAAHPVTLPSFGSAGSTDAHWATAISFPIADQDVYRVIANEPPDD
jgi:hypothetical protein